MSFGHNYQGLKRAIIPSFLLILGLVYNSGCTSGRDFRNAKLLHDKYTQSGDASYSGTRLDYTPIEEKDKWDLLEDGLPELNRGVKETQRTLDSFTEKIPGSPKINPTKRDRLITLVDRDF